MEFLKPKYDGIVPDPRSEKEKAKDWDSKEIALGVSEGSKLTVITIPHYDQQQTSSCTAHAILSMMEYNKVLKKDVSRYPLYRKRFNYPGEGSNATDLIQKSHSEHSTAGGLTLYESLAHPAKLTEVWANSIPYVIGKDITVPFSYFTITDWNDLERAVNSGVAVTMGFYSTVSEWSREYVEERDSVTPSNARVRHQICLMPKGAFYENGKLWFSILDSALFGGRKIRYATLDFLKNRVIVQPQFAIPKDIPIEEPPKPIKTLSACKLGDSGVSVKNLQNFLISQKFLAPQYSTGYYGQLTAKAVLWFQLYYHDEFKETIPELLDYKGEFFGSQSVKVAKSL